LAACSLDSAEPSVRTGRADRTATTPPTTEAVTSPTTTAAPSTTASTSTTTTSTTSSPTTTPDRASPDSSQPGVLALPQDGLDNGFLPGNPELVAAGFIATDGRDAITFLSEELTFTDAAPALIVTGAPITRWSYEIAQPEFNESGVTSADVVAVSHRFALQIENDDVDTFAEGLRDEFLAAVATSDPDAQISTTTDEGVLGQPIFGFTVGTPDLPTMTVEVGQHYLIVPRFVDEPLLAVDVTRILVDPVAEELPSRDRVITEPLETQLAVLDPPADQATVRLIDVGLVIPSDGIAIIQNGADLDYPVPDGFAAFVDGLATALEAGGYERDATIGNPPTFVTDEPDRNARFQVSDDEPDVARVIASTGPVPFTSD